MEYKGLILGAKCAPIGKQLRRYSRFQHIELSIPRGGIGSKFYRRRAIRTTNKFKKKHGLQLTLHCSYKDIYGSFRYFYDSFEFARQVDADLVIVHPSIRDRNYENWNGIPVALEIMKRLCKPEHVFHYMGKHHVKKIVYDLGHVAGAKLDIRETFNEFLPYIVGVHHSNNTSAVLHQNIDVEGGIIPLSDYRYILKKLRDKKPIQGNGCDVVNVVEVGEINFNIPTNTEHSFGVLKGLVDSLNQTI
jgi:sugar phosphate isomerase/epimerase